MLGECVFTDHLLMLFCVWQQLIIGKGRSTGPSSLDTAETGHAVKLQCDPLSVIMLLQIKLTFQLQSLYQLIAPAPTAADVPVPEIFGSIR